MSQSVSSRELFRRVAAEAESSVEVECKPLRTNLYVQGQKSLVALIRTDDRRRGLEEALRALGGIARVIRNLGQGAVLLKPNCNSHDLFPASTHPDTLRFIIDSLAEAGVPKAQMVVGDMSGPAWLPTEATMRKNGILNTAEELGVQASFFEEGAWVRVRPEQALSWPEGFRIAKAAYEASRVISLPCLKTHQFGGVFTLSLKNTVGLLNPADRTTLHKKPGDRIAEINLAYTADLIVLDGLECFVSGGPAHGTKGAPGVLIAGSDRVAVDAVGVSVLKRFEADGISDMKVQDHIQLRRAAEIGLGQVDGSKIAIRASNLADDSEFDDLLRFVKRQL